MEIYNAVVIVSILGAIMGLLIAIASSIFYVKEDTRVVEVAAMLPQFNCGACGTPGCQAMAEELVNSRISVEKCRPAKPEQRTAIIDKLKELEIEVV